MAKILHLNKLIRFSDATFRKSNLLISGLILYCSIATFSFLSRSPGMEKQADSVMPGSSWVTEAPVHVVHTTPGAGLTIAIEA